MNTFIGVDLGGTNVRVAKVDEQGNLLQTIKHDDKPRVNM